MVKDLRDLDCVLLKKTPTSTDPMLKDLRVMLFLKFLVNYFNNLLEKSVIDNSHSIYQADLYEFYILSLKNGSIVDILVINYQRSATLKKVIKEYFKIDIVID